jgi:hypothetical protein
MAAAGGLQEGGTTGSYKQDPLAYGIVALLISLTTRQWLAAHYSSTWHQYNHCPQLGVPWQLGVSWVTAQGQQVT